VIVRRKKRAVPSRLRPSIARFDAAVSCISSLPGRPWGVCAFNSLSFNGIWLDTEFSTGTIGGEYVDVLFAGAQGQFLGLDQVNLTLPQGLHTRSETDVVLTVDGQVAKRVRVNLKDHQP